MDSNNRQNLPDLESEYIPNECKHQSKQAIRLLENAFHPIPDLLIYSKSTALSRAISAAVRRRINTALSFN
jgi:hypothetical protein